MRDFLLCPTLFLNAITCTSINTVPQASGPLIRAQKSTEARSPKLKADKIWLLQTLHSKMENFSLAHEESSRGLETGFRSTYNL